MMDGFFNLSTNSILTNVRAKLATRSGPNILYNTSLKNPSIMLNPIEKFKVAILHLNRDWNH